MNAHRHEFRTLHLNITFCDFIFSTYIQHVFQAVILKCVKIHIFFLNKVCFLSGLQCSSEAQQN